MQNEDFMPERELPETEALPRTWLATNLGSVVDYGKTIKSEPEELTSDTWVLELEDIEKDSAKVLQRLTFAERQSKSTKNRFDAGDVLYGKLRPYLNKVVYADRPGVCTTEIVPIKPNDTVDGRYLFHWLRHPQFLTYVTEVSHGVNMPRLGTEAGKQAPFVLAPKDEQTRIADKLDTVLGRVDAVNARLARVAPLLKRFRQSVLAAATSGRLTEDWSDSNEINAPWRDVMLGDVIEDMRNGLAAKPDENLNGKKILRISAVRPGALDISDHRYLTTGISDANTYSLRRGDLLFTRYNGSLEYVGVCAMVSENLPNYVYPDKLIRVRAKTEVALPKFLELAASAAEARRQIEGYVKSSAGQKGISSSSLKTLEISVPGMEEQTEIVRRVETLFAFADRLEARLQAAGTAAERLTPALLAKAFRGELVPQDPNDEPAAELLQRLQASHTAAAPKRGKGKSAA